MSQFLEFSSSRSNIYTSAIYLVVIGCYAIWSWHSDWTRERMWHYLLPVLAAIPCFAIWTHVAAQQSFGGIKPIALYGLAFLGNLVSISQPAALTYRSSTLYGAAEQAVGGATAIAALSVASIIGPQVSDHTRKLPFSVLTFLDLPYYRPTVVSSWLFCLVCHFSLYRHWIRQSSPLASYGGTSTKEEDWTRHAFPRPGRRRPRHGVRWDQDS